MLDVENCTKCLVRKMKIQIIIENEFFYVIYVILSNLIYARCGKLVDEIFLENIINEIEHVMWANVKLTLYWNLLEILINFFLQFSVESKKSAFL